MGRCVRCVLKTHFGVDIVCIYVCMDIVWYNMVWGYVSGASCETNLAVL